MSRRFAYCLEGQEFPDVEEAAPRQDIYRCGVGTNLKVHSVLVVLEDGERNVVPYKLTAGGKTLLVIPALEGSHMQLIRLDPPTPVENGVVFGVECLELPKIRPVRGFGTLWLEVDD